MPPTDSKKNWFITGASSGLGLEMALAALHAGHRVIGTGRNVNAAAKSCPEFEKLGGEWLQLDASQQDAQQAVEYFLAGEKQQNQHWVIVNNAGSSLIGSVEDMSSAQINAYMQANLHGPIRVWKACLPLLRRNRTGTLITLSSAWGFVPKSEHMLYSAAKAALESLTESYADLLGPLGIRVMIVEPGGFRTGFPGNAGRSDLGVTRDYRERIGAWMRVLDEASRDETVVNGDPGLFGERVLDAVDGRGAFKKLWEAQEMGRVLRVPLGSDCYGLLGQRLKELGEAYARMAEIAKSTDVANE